MISVMKSVLIKAVLLLPLLRKAVRITNLHKRCKQAFMTIRYTARYGSPSSCITAHIVELRVVFIKHAVKIENKSQRLSHRSLVAGHYG